MAVFQAIFFIANQNSMQLVHIIGLFPLRYSPSASVIPSRSQNDWWIERDLFTKPNPQKG